MEKAAVFWFFGLSGSGKSTLADAFALRLKSTGQQVLRLDGDQLRAGLNKDLGYSSEDRLENIRRASEIAKLSIHQGISVVASFISPQEIHRSKVREILENRVQLIFVNASLKICAMRDVKGLYQQEKTGEISSFTGISAPFEEPMDVNIQVSTEESSVEECLDQIWNHLKGEQQ